MTNKTKPVENGQKTEDIKPAQKFPLEKLRANCLKLFGVTTSTFVGATHGMRGNFSVEEMKKQIEDWKKGGTR